jgi:hypothetical protein
MINQNRRDFIKKTAVYSAFTIISSKAALSVNHYESQLDKLQHMLKDPVYDMIKGKPDLDQILKLFPRPEGIPAFDPALIQENIKNLRTVPVINTGHAFLDLSVRTALAHIDATFQGDHPKYGVGSYAGNEHDGFPPVIIATVDALSAWGLNERAARLFNYWLTNFVKEDGTFNYYGPSISEYGQMLHTATILEERAGTDGWFNDGFKKLDSIAELLLRLLSSASSANGLVAGIPEADTRDQIDVYFHNNAWIVKGLDQWASLCTKTRYVPSSSVEAIRKSVSGLKEKTIAAILKTWSRDQSDWWLPGQTGNVARPKFITETNEGSYTNYRYWPELLSSGILPRDLATRLINARLTGGGQFCGTTRFLGWIDDWPLTDYLYSLWAYGRKNDFLVSLYGHVAYAQCEGHLTAYEQMSFPGDPHGSKRADYCLPCQLVAARAARLLNIS